MGTSQTIYSKTDGEIIEIKLQPMTEEEVHKYHEQELKLKFKDVFNRKFMLSCKLFVKNYNNGTPAIYTKSSTSNFKIEQ